MFAILTLVATAFLYSCSDELDSGHYDDLSDYICFRAAVEGEDENSVTRSIGTGLNTEEEEWLCGFSLSGNGSDTRGVPLKKLGDNIGLFGYKFPSNEDMNNERKSWEIMTNRKFVNDGDEFKAESDPIHWSSIHDEENLQIYAYSPYAGSSSVTGLVGYPNITYDTYGVDIPSQSDIVVAETLVTPADRKKPIQLTFNHLLTAVRFKAHFKCKVMSVTIKNVYNSGNFSFAPGGTDGSGWTINTTRSDGNSAKSSYTVTFDGGKVVEKDGLITSDENTMMLIPQALPDDATVEMECYPYDEKNGVFETSPKTFTASLKGKVWKQKKIVTYILHDKGAHNFVYLDLAAANVTITSSTCTGAYYKTDNGERQKVDVNIGHSVKNVYHIYQSTDGTLRSVDNRSTTGLVDGQWVLPVYDEVMFDSSKGITWSDFITNNDSVEYVIHAWDNKEGTAGAVRDAKRGHTQNWIKITTPLECDVIIDNIYTRYQETSTARKTGGIAVHGDGSGKSTVTINYIGDNRLGSLHCNNKNSNQKLILQGTGSLTVADADYVTVTASGSESGGNGYWSNHWNAAIGNNDGANDCYGIIINSGTLFAGTTRAENCTAIGGGGNGHGEVIINGGVVTAVASTTGTAIGGGIGFHSPGGPGYVEINGGNIYAYNKGNRWDIPSSAIGGAGSYEAAGREGTVIINNGYVYAQSALGTAIGGGSSYSKAGGAADITINGGTVVAKSVPALGGDKGKTPGKVIQGGAGIGGGSASTGGDNPIKNDTNNNDNGGFAKITIKGTPTIRTGSIGGGLTFCSGGKIGSADITIEDGDIQAQFIMAAGSAGEKPKFLMKGGTIHNSDVKDDEFKHVRDYGGAVYLEDGTCVIETQNAASPPRIKGCSAKKGGAIYVVGENSPSFRMTGGTIEDCIAEDDISDGGAVYIEGGNVTIGGNAIIRNNIANGGNGGGVCVKLGNFEMSGEAQVSMNTTLFTENHGGNGGGVYVTSSSTVSVNIESGSITDNSASRKGGGVCVDMPDENKTANVTLGRDDAEELENPVITRNIALEEGGGLYVIGKNSKVDIYDGFVVGNDVSSYVANEDVANERGMVTLHSGNVSHVKIVFDGNGGTVENDGVTKTVVQNIVTATNSLIVMPENMSTPMPFVNMGYKFKGWNTRKDGNGVTYTNGQLVNIKEGFTLYAQWEMDE